MVEKEKRKTLESLIDTSAKALNDLIDVNTVIGKPFLSASGTQIIPFTKVTVAYLTGGGEYGDVKTIKEDGKLFTGATGNVVTMKPSGFLIDDGKGCRLIRVSDEPFDNLLEKTEDVLTRYMQKEE